jgi:lipopolysaccharide export system protein LptA
LEQGTSRLRADRVFADLRRREARADGHVLLDHHDMRGSADHATYSEAAQTAVLDGHVVLLRGRDTLTAQRATVLLDRDTAIAEGDVSLVAYPEGSQP